MFSDFFSESDISDLAEFLQSEYVPETCMGIFSVEGFLTAVALCLAPVTPSEWMRWIWDRNDGKKTPEFTDVDQAGHVVGILSRYFNHLVFQMEGGSFEPLFHGKMADESAGFRDAEEWCQGFVRGMSVFYDLWQPMLGQPELTAPMLMMGTENGRKVLKDSKDGGHAMKMAVQAVAPAVAELNEWRRQFVIPEPQIPVRRAGPKLGRNDPCACGSGKKFKKCCGAD